MAVLAYCGPLIIISYLAAKDDSFTKFHIKQALTIIIVGFVLSFLSMFMFFSVGIFFGMAKMALGIFMIIGILNAAQGKETELPFIGQLAKSLNF